MGQQQRPADVDSADLDSAALPGSPNWRRAIAAWALAALAALAPCTLLLGGSFPLFSVLWLVVPLVVLTRTRDAGRVGARGVPWPLLARVTAVNLAVALAPLLLCEPWSHTYQRLIELALAGPATDTTFAWLTRYPRLPALVGMTIYSGLVTLFAEELFFRGWLLQALLRRLAPAAAIGLQALAFAAPNAIAALLLPPLQGALYLVVYAWFAIGIVGGWAAWRTGSIWPSLVSATLANLAIVILVT